MNKFALKAQEIQLVEKLRSLDHYLWEMEFQNPNGKSAGQIQAERLEYERQLGLVRLQLYQTSGANYAN